MSDLSKQLAAVLNRASRENVSNTPDFLLGDYLEKALEAYEELIKKRGNSLMVSLSDRQNYVQRMLKAMGQTVHQRDEWAEPEAKH